jgi:hypothetical protein
MNNLASLDIVKTIQSVKVTPKESEEVRVQRQLKHWLDPGWCMTPPVGSEPKVNRKRKRMLWWISGVLMLLGLAGLITNCPTEALVSIALPLVIVIALVRLIMGKMPVVLEGKK